MRFRTILWAVPLLASLWTFAQQPAPTIAERLGWPKDAKVVIFHIDDAGMSHSSNLGTIQALTEGAATSCSIMMPCSWVSGFYAWLKDHPDTDAGLHLTFTSEWDNYRWGPLAGKNQVPGLADKEGCLWDNVPLVLEHATADEIELEIRAQVDRALTMGIQPTHLDSHMGTLFADPAFTARYIKVGIEMQIPILFPGGHLQYLSQDSPMPPDTIRTVAQTVWEGGLPLVDDIFADTYGWPRAQKTERYIKLLEGMRPGLLEIICHPSDPTDVFPVFTPSSDTRKGDLEAMLDPKLKEVIQKEGIILTTWRELKQRRDALKK